MDIEARVLAALDAGDFAYDRIPVDPELADTAAFCEHYGYPPETSANTLLVASKKPTGHYAACVVLATTRLDVNTAVRKKLGVRRCSFATAEQMHELTGMLVGGVTPFGLPPDLRLWIDARVMACAKVVVGGGSRSLKIEISPEALAALPLAEVVEDLAVPL